MVVSGVSPGSRPPACVPSGRTESGDGRGGCAVGGPEAPWGPGVGGPAPLDRKSPPPTLERTTPRAGGDPGRLSHEQKIPLPLGLFQRAEGRGSQMLRE